MISSFDLRMGDDDAKRRWGGAVRPPSETNSDVADLKAALVAVGVLDAKKVGVRGQFGVDTRDAVIRLQWYLENVPGYVGPRGTFVDRVVDSGLGRDGVAGAVVRATLRNWITWSCVCAGNLVRGNFMNYANIFAGSGFTELLGPEEFVVDRGFISAVDGAQALAATNKLTVRVNQFFRVEGAAVSGAVVTPAGFSAHKIGRAVDLQLANAGGPLQMSAAIKAAKVTDPFGKFREGMKSDHGCRYGGEFQTVDAPHFDRQVLPAGNLDWKCLFYFNQRHLRQGQVNPETIPLASV